MRNLLPKYFSSEWSFAQFRVPDVRTIVAFGQEPANSIIGNWRSLVWCVVYLMFLFLCLMCMHVLLVVSADGTYYKATFDPNRPGTEMVQEAYAKFVTPPDDPV